MSDPVDAVRTRILPALLTALGVTLLAAGLLSYTTPVEAGPAAGGSVTGGSAGEVGSGGEVGEGVGTRPVSSVAATVSVGAPADDPVVVVAPASSGATGSFPHATRATMRATGTTSGSILLIFMP